MIKDAPITPRASDKKTESITGPREAKDTGTDETFAGSNQDEQPSRNVFYVDEIDVPETEVTPISNDDMAKLILSGLIMAGIGVEHQIIVKQYIQINQIKLKRNTENVKKKASNSLYFCGKR